MDQEPTADETEFCLSNTLGVVKARKPYLRPHKESLDAAPVDPQPVVPDDDESDTTR